MEEEHKPKLTPVLTILEQAVKIWWKNLKKFILVYLWGLLFTLIPIAVIFLFFGLDKWFGPVNSISFQILGLLILTLGILLALYFSIRTYIAIFLLVKKGYHGQELDIFKESSKYFWPYLGLVVLSTIFILLWTLLLIIPGIIYSVFYCLAIYVFFFEGKTGLAAIKRSIKLISNYWWPVFGRLVVLGIAMWLFMMIISLPISFTVEGGTFFHIWNTVIQIISFLIGPIALLFTYHIYQDLVKIKHQ